MFWVEEHDENDQLVLSGSQAGEILKMLKKMDKNMIHIFCISNKIQGLTDMLAKRVEGEDSSFKLFLITNHEEFLKYEALLTSSEEEFDLFVSYFLIADLRTTYLSSSILSLSILKSVRS